MTTTQVSPVRRATRWLSPAAFLLAGFLLFTPFVTVSCDAPGGFGHAAPGGTTTYTGITLVTGGAPTVTPANKIRPVAQQRDDRIGSQPMAIALAVLILGGIAAAVAIGHRLTRRVTVTVVAAVATVFLLANQVTVRALLQARLREQLAVPMPAGKSAGDYIHDQKGFWACLLTLLALAVANGVGWLRLRRESNNAMRGTG